MLCQGILTEREGSVRMTSLQPLRSAPFHIDKIFFPFLHKQAVLLRWSTVLSLFIQLQLVKSNFWLTFLVLHNTYLFIIFPFLVKRVPV
jgi:hypothetical protein